MINTDLLLEEMEKEGYTIESLASKIQVDAKVLRHRFEKPTEFTVGEVMRIVKTLNIDADTATLIFFDIRQTVPPEVLKWYEEMYLPKKRA